MDKLVGLSFRFHISLVSGLASVSLNTAFCLLFVKGLQLRGQAGMAVGLCYLYLQSSEVDLQAWQPLLSSRRPGSRPPCPILAL